MAKDFPRYVVTDVKLPSIFTPEGKEGVYDVVVEEGRITRIGRGGTPHLPRIAGEGLFLLPGVWDCHIHLRDPGELHKEEIATGTRAAVSGGVTTVVAMANTHPPNDTPEVTRYILEQTRSYGWCRVLPVSAATVGLKGEELVPYYRMKEAGCVAVSDDGASVASARVMLRILEYASSFGLPVLVHAEDAELRQGGVIHEGIISQELGLAGIPREAEIVAIARDLELARRSGAHLHIQHLTTREGLELLRRAKASGMHVTCEVTPHHLFFSHFHLRELGTNGKISPPLREPSDVKALREGLAEGVIDCIASDHAPHAPWEKELPWEEAPFGVIGLETLLPATMRLKEEGVITLEQVCHLLILRPRELFGVVENPLAPGAPADFFLYDPEKEWVYDPLQGMSRSRNSPFAGTRFHGQVVATVVAGIPRHDPYGLFSNRGITPQAGIGF